MRNGGGTIMTEIESGLGNLFLDTVKEEFSRIKVRAEKAIAQVREDRQLHAKPDAESNSIASIVTHLSGNMLSRWTDFLTTDGEKPSRRRDAEFEPPETMTRTELLAAWEKGWACLFNAVDALTPADLGATVRVKGEEFSVLEAIVRQFSHYASHIGQIVFLAKHLEWERWQSLSIPRRKP
jgi:methionyl-tRNA formyltransferase